MLVLASLIAAAGGVFAGAYVALDARSSGGNSSEPPAATGTTGATGVPTDPSTATPPTATPTARATPSPTTAPRTYTVQPGDSYSIIAERFGVTVNQLLAVNNRTLNDQLFPGVVLRLP